MKGFTLIELLVVTAIIGILAVICVPVFQGHEAGEVLVKQRESETNCREGVLYNQDGTPVLDEGWEVTCSNFSSDKK